MQREETRLADAFAGYLERVGRSAATRDVYLRVVGHLFSSFNADEIPALTAGEVDLHLARWRAAFTDVHSRPPSRSTYRNQVNALRAFYAWLERFDLLRRADGSPLANPMRSIDAPRVEQRSNDWLQPAEDRALASALIPAHERFIVMLLRWTGLRVSEAVSVTTSDIDVTSGAETLFVRESKTPAGRRAIPLLPPLLSELHAWNAAFSRESAPRTGVPLLATRNGSPMKPTYVWRVVKRASFRAGIRVVACTCGSGTTRHARDCARTRSGEHLSRVSPHTLRRTFGSHLLNRGVRLEVVSKLLGHASTSVT